MKEASHHYQIPEEPGRLRALGLALFVHLLLLGLLWFGVSWQSDTPVAVEAEIWNPVAREAAPLPPPPPPAPEPAKPVAPAEPPKPEPVAEPVKAKLPDPDIALEKEKKRKQEKEEAERKKKEQLAEKKAREEEEKRKQLAEALEREKEKEKEKEKKKLAELEKQKQTEEQKRKEQAAADEKKRLAEEEQRKQEELALEQRAKRRREEDQRRLMQQAGDGGAGDAEKSQAPRSDGSYARRVAALIKSHTILPQTDIPGNPAAEFTIELLPDGSLRGEPKMTRSSGITPFDQAVRRAIEKSVPFPPDPATGKVPSSISVSHRPKDTDQR